MMLNRYQGNSGRVVRVDEQSYSRAQAPARYDGGGAETRPAPAHLPRQRQPAPRRRQDGGLGETLSKLLPSKPGALETEDLILLLILYLMYRESGDSELLIIMGAMFLL